MIHQVKFELVGSSGEVAQEARRIADALHPVPPPMVPDVDAMRACALVFHYAGEAAIGNKIALIKAVRTVFGCELKEAKNIVEGGVTP